MRLAACAAAVFVIISGVSGAVRARQARTVILAADLGTHLQPIAQLGPMGWSPVPRSGLGRLAPGEWTRWMPDGRPASIRLGVREPTGRCAVPGRMPVAGAQADRTDGRPIGIASSGAIEVEPVRPAKDGSPEWMQVRAAAETIFLRREREHGVSSSAFAQVPVTLDRAYGSGRRAGGRVYYFEASKRVFDAGETPEEDPKGIVRITVSGWLRESDGRLVAAGTKGELYWDPVDEESPVPQTALTPIGVLRDGAEQIWVMNGHTGVRESFILYTLGATVRPLGSVDAAAC